MQQLFILFFLSLISIFATNKSSEHNELTATDIIQNTITSIDTIETIYYKQDMYRTDYRNMTDTIFRYREMYFERLVSDSIVGVKGHWFMYDDNKNIVFEDIYDGNRLIRKNNIDSLAKVYDLLEYPEFKTNHFWSHNTLYGMQYEFKFILNNLQFYTLERLDDTIYYNKSCYQILIKLDNYYLTMPGFWARLDKSEGSVTNNLYFIDKETNYPIRMKSESYSIDNPSEKTFIDQRYYDLRFNNDFNEEDMFNTASSSLNRYAITEMNPK